MAKDSCVVRDILADKVSLLQDYLTPDQNFLGKLFDRGIINEDDLEEVKGIRNVRRRVLNLVCTVTTVKPELEVREFRQIICQQHPDIAKSLGMNIRQKHQTRAPANATVGKNSYAEVRQAEKQKRRERAEALKKERQRSREYKEKWQQAVSELELYRVKLEHYLDVFNRLIVDVNQQVKEKLDVEVKQQRQSRKELDEEIKKKNKELRDAEDEVDECDEELEEYKRRLGLRSNAKKSEVDRQLQIMVQKDEKVKQTIQMPMMDASKRRAELKDVIEQLKNDKGQAKLAITYQTLNHEATTEISKYLTKKDASTSKATNKRGPALQKLET